MPGPAAAGLSLVFPERCSSGYSLSPLTTHDPRMEAGLWWRKIFGERSYQTPMPLLRISQCRVFSRVCSIAPLRKAKTSPMQCVVSKPNCKCLPQQQPHCAVAHASTNMLQEDRRLEWAPIPGPASASWGRDAQARGSCLRHHDLPPAGLIDGLGPAAASPAGSCSYLAVCKPTVLLETPWLCVKSSSAGVSFSCLFSR